MPLVAAEHVSFELSPLAEAVHSWHVLVTPGHHALQLPWVRGCRPSSHARRQEPTELLGGLRALGAQPRLEIVRLFGAQPRSTQELSGLLGLSGAAVSRHLRQLLDAGLVRTRREGYYVLYEVVAHRLVALGQAIRGLG
ncbi:hypothetical protein DMB66_09650 [Actinoplanes sp. ATCC 53533]|nr:hypothetical protein DMB66_09650 [Actinoplanes sp. ATCC 53533]